MVNWKDPLTQRLQIWWFNTSFALKQKVDDFLHKGKEVIDKQTSKLKESLEDWYSAEREKYLSNLEKITEAKNKEIENKKKQIEKLKNIKKMTDEERKKASALQKEIDELESAKNRTDEEQLQYLDSLDEDALSHQEKEAKKWLELVVRRKHFEIIKKKREAIVKKYQHEMRMKVIGKWSLIVSIIFVILLTLYLIGKSLFVINPQSLLLNFHVIGLNKSEIFVPSDIDKDKYFKELVSTEEKKQKDANIEYLIITNIRHPNMIATNYLIWDEIVKYINKKHTKSKPFFENTQPLATRQVEDNNEKNSNKYFYHHSENWSVGLTIFHWLHKFFWWTLTREDILNTIYLMNEKQKQTNFLFYYYPIANNVYIKELTKAFILEKITSANLWTTLKVWVYLPYNEITSWNKVLENNDFKVSIYNKNNKIVAEKEWYGSFTFNLKKWKYSILVINEKDRIAKRKTMKLSAKEANSFWYEYVKTSTGWKFKPILKDYPNEEVDWEKKDSTTMPILLHEYDERYTWLLSWTYTIPMEDYPL